MYCGHCGNRIPEDAAFCNYCGSTVTSTSVPPIVAISSPTPQLHESTVATDSLQTQQPTIPTEQQATVYGVTPQPMPLSSPMLAYPGNPQSSSSLPTMSGQFPSSSGVVWTQPAPSAVPPLQIPFSPNATQRLLIRVFQPALASNPWLGIILGSLLAIVGGVLVSALVLVIAHNILSINMHNVASSGYSIEDREDGLLGIYPLHASFRDSLQLFLVIQGPALHFFSTSTSNSNSYMNTYTSYSPLNGLLLLPALLLTFSGYLSACTDFQNRFSTSLWRGAAIALPYTFLLSILASQVNGPAIGVDGLTLNVDMPEVLLFGLLWGALFGMLGASLKISQGKWRHMLYSFVRTNTRPQLLGSVIGSLAAIGLGLALTLLTLYAFVANTSYSAPILASNACILTNWQSLTLWSIVQGPIHAVNAFAFSFGAPLTFVNQMGSSSCFYTPATHATLSLLDPTIHQHSWLYALLLIPGLSLFLGGRASVAASRVRHIGPAAIQGALIALPFTIFMIVLALLSVISNVSITSTSTTTSSSTLIQSASVDMFNMLLWALLSSAFFGLLGGMYQASPLQNGVRTIGVALAYPLRLVCEPLYKLLDLCSGQSHLSQRSLGRTFLYATLLVTVLLAVVTFVVGSYLINANQSLTFDDNQRIFNVLSVLVITLPGILLLCSAATALSTDPYPSSSSQLNYAVAPVVQMQRGL